MNLEKIPLADRAKLTSQFPVLLIGQAGVGKTRALENLSTEDKKRTLVINIDTKACGTGDSGEFAAVFSVSTSRDLLEEQLAALPADAVEYKKHFEKLLATSYFLDDPESIDRIVGHIAKATFSPKIDRIVLDTFKQLDVFCEEWGQKNAPDSRAGWGMYGTSLQRVMQAIKESSLHGFKFSYVYGHHPTIPAQSYDSTPKRMPDVKGNIMKGEVESGFNTVIYTHRDLDGKIFFESNVNNPNDTSRNKLVDSAFKFERTSLNDIELYLNGLATIKDFKLIPKKTK